MPYCQICGTEYFEGRMFCRKCGTTLPRPEPSTVQPETAGPDPDVAPPEGSAPQGWDSMPRAAEAPRGGWLTRNAPLVFAAVVFVAVVILAAVWLSKKSLPSDFYKADGFALRPPAGWRIDKSGALGPKVFFFGPTAGGFTVNINVVKAPSGGLTLTDLAERNRETFPRLFTSFRLIEDEPKRVEGNDGYIFGGTYTRGVYTLRARQLLEVKNGVVYVVTATDAATDWPVQEATLESTLETFRPT